LPKARPITTIAKPGSPRHLTSAHRGMACRPAVDRPTTPRVTLAIGLVSDDIVLKRGRVAVVVIGTCCHSL